MNDQIDFILFPTISKYYYTTLEECPRFLNLVLKPGDDPLLIIENKPTVPLPALLFFKSKV